MKPLRADDGSLTVGTVLLGKYQVDAILGTGGMGVVAKCRHLGLDEPVAIKLLRPDARLDGDTLARFVREAQAAVKLKSEHVARVSDVGTLENGLPYMVMEFLAGMDLGQWIADQGPVSPPLAVNLVVQACEALAEAHSLGIVHRDVKPTNLFVSWRPDGSPLIKVLDFGISKSMASAGMSLTQTASLLGSPAYMSPEQMRSARTVDARTDIWSLGAVVYEAIEGRRPFWADSFAELCMKVTLDPVEPMTVAEPALQEVILHALAKNPAERYATVAEFAAALIPFARDPDEARRLVERMQRMLGRRSQATMGGTDFNDPSSTYSTRDGSRRELTPPPRSGPIQRAELRGDPTPVPAPISAAMPAAPMPRPTPTPTPTPTPVIPNTAPISVTMRAPSIPERPVGRSPSSIPGGHESGPATIPENHTWSQQTLDELAALGLASSVTTPMGEPALGSSHDLRAPTPTSYAITANVRLPSVTGSTDVDTAAIGASRRWLWLALAAAGLIVGSLVFAFTRGGPAAKPAATQPAAIVAPAHGAAATVPPDAGVPIDAAIIAPPADGGAPHDASASKPHVADPTTKPNRPTDDPPRIVRPPKPPPKPPVGPRKLTKKQCQALRISEIFDHPECGQ